VEKEILETGHVELNIEFDFDSAVIRPQYESDIRDVASFMNKCPDTKIIIEGHTDAVGAAEYNQTLSELRAKSVKQYIIDKFNIDGKRLEAVGYGESKPIADNNTKDGRQRNRRVEAVLVK
jgi:OOP family OmpA-OmpF porin